MSVIDDYLATLKGPEKELIERMCKSIRQLVPDATEEMSYAMPAFKYRGKGLAAIIANKHFLSLYPFTGVAKLGVDLSDYECTSGSIHFTVDKPIPEKLLRQIITARLEQIDSRLPR